jgi:phosphoglycolate phosphatase
MDERRNKKGDVIAYALQKAGIADKHATIMVGDRLHDVHGAKENALPSVGVLWGYGSERELLEAGATHVVRDMPELLTLLTGGTL